MKQQDIAIVIIIVFFAGIFSFFLSNQFLSGDNEKQTAEVVAPIYPDFVTPSNKYFNDKSINPTRTIEIAPTNNKKPFEDNK